MIEIKLEFDDSLKVLAGVDFGYQVYVEQLKNVFDIDSINKLEFPENIKIVCSSFVIGLFSELLEKYSPDEIYEKLEFSDGEIRKHIQQGLYDY